MIDIPWGVILWAVAGMSLVGWGLLLGGDVSGKKMGDARAQGYMEGFSAGVDSVALTREANWRRHGQSMFAAGKAQGRADGYAEGLRDAMNGNPKLYAAAYKAGQEAGRAERSGAAAFSTSDIEALVQLTHPDRHPAERQAEANRLTSLLLSMRRGAKV